MTLLVAGFVPLVTILISTFFGLFIEGAAQRVRAQAAADAAALAAVAESAPGAAGAHAEEARRFAEGNGASLIRCVCEPGTTSVVVTVAVGGSEATARATIDPNAFLGDPTDPDASRLDPRLEATVERLMKASGGRVTLVSGWRSSYHQQELWAEALIEYGDPEIADNWVARPGTSMHERGLAVDLGGDLDLAVSLVERLGLPIYRPMTNEPWHFELVGSR
jgi:hypothetical protein